MDNKTSQNWKNDRFERKSTLGQICLSGPVREINISFEPIKLRLCILLADQKFEDCCKMTKNWGLKFYCFVQFSPNKNFCDLIEIQTSVFTVTLLVFEILSCKTSTFAQDFAYLKCLR